MLPDMSFARLRPAFSDKTDAITRKSHTQHRFHHPFVPRVAWLVRLILIADHAVSLGWNPTNDIIREVRYTWFLREISHGQIVW